MAQGMIPRRSIDPGPPNAGCSHEHDDQGGVMVNGVNDVTVARQGRPPELVKYPELLTRAIQQRTIPATGQRQDVRELYLFWKSFLVQDFNVRVYEAFRSFALEDARQQVPDTYGLEKLLGFYEGVLGVNPPVWRQDKPIPGLLLQHQREAQQLSQTLKTDSNP